MTFINDDFLLKTKTAKHLYHDYAKQLPIIDYHCHLNPAQIADDIRFDNIGELFLSGDHYKWRVMRSNGIDEKYITGNSSYHDKFIKFASSIMYCMGNPILHWTQLELKRYFDIDEILSERTAENIWGMCNSVIDGADFSAKNLIKNSNVEVICTTDDPKDTLEYHKRIKESGFGTKVFPTFRPDKALDIEKDAFLEYISGVGVKSYDELTTWIVDRIKYFNNNGCRLSDHGMEFIPYREGDASSVFEKKMNNGQLTCDEIEIFKTDILKVCGREYAKFGWTMQLHIGALRNNNKRMFNILGPDTGFDSINDLCIAEKLSRFLNSLDVEDMLPKTILYTLNPKDNYVLGTMLGNFQSAPVPGKIQFGSGWWFNDQKDGMEEQMKALGNLGVLGRFVGMLTDSRSFVSYPRHEYFRRILCNLVGAWVEDGLYPDNEEILRTIIEGISYKNAKEYFKF